ncbi:MAG TPA: hypothetical protein VN414_07595, partial [Methanosarcina sp.]|nr:hypothetical protein [Methanosarcina sp.]
MNLGRIQFFQSPKTLQSLVSLFSFIVYNLANDFNFFTIASAKSGLNQINQIEKNLEKYSKKYSKEQKKGKKNSRGAEFIYCIPQCSFFEHIMLPQTCLFEEKDQRPLGGSFILIIPQFFFPTPTHSNEHKLY